MRVRRGLARRRVLARVLAIGAALGGPRRRRPLAAAAPRIDPEALERLRGRLRGHLVVPDDDAYESARRVFYWNPRTERSPVAVVRCGHDDDVARAVEFARRHDLEIAVRAGGHAHLGWGSSDGLVIDLAPLQGIHVDPARRVLRAEAGVLGGAAAIAAGRHGLAPVFGQCPGVGATGVTLGGGLGWLSGLHGACCDNLLTARVVTADSRSLDVDTQHDPDLFWGLRGAGANFGVTTSLEVRLHPVGDVVGGDIHYAVRDARAVLRGFRDVMHGAPDAFQATLNLTPGPRGLFISLCHAGDPASAEALLGQLRAIARPTAERVSCQSYAALATRAAATNPGTGPAPAFRTIQTVYRDALDDDVVDVIVERLGHAPPDAIMGLSHYMHGAVCRVAADATAFPHRRAHSVHVRVACSWTDPAETAARFAWGEEWVRLLRPPRDERIYANYQTYDAAAGAAAIYGPNHARLVALKRRLDPTNEFRRNANVPG